MRHAAFFLLGLTALVLLPAASALSAGTALDATVAAGAPAPVQPAGPDELPALALVDESVPAVQSGGATISLPAVAAQAEVAAAASIGSAAPPAAAAPPPGPPQQVGPSSSQGSPIDPVAAAAAAAVAAPLVAIALGAAGGFGLRALTAQAGAWTVRGVRALLALLALAPFALFSRIERGALLDNPVRARVHDAVLQEPGLTLSEVQARAGIAWGTTVHHLRRLEAHGLLVSTPRGGHRHYFIANTPAAAQRLALATLKQPTARRIANLVAVQPGIDQSTLCQTLGLNGPSASKHLDQFRGQGLVESQRVGRRTVHRPTSGLLAALGLAVPGPAAWTHAPAAVAPAMLVAAT